MSCQCSNNSSLYVTPSCTTTEMVILTDERNSYGVLHTDCNTVALSSVATQIMVESFKAYPRTLSELTRLFGCETEALLNDFNTDRIITLLPTAPPKEQSTQYPVASGEAINPNSKTPVYAQYPGLVFCFKVGSVWIYIYISLVALNTITNDASIPSGNYAVGNYGELGRTLYPVGSKSALGANCSVCGACGGCGACGACALCGGVNYGVAAIALVAVDAALAVTSALNAFTASRPNRP